MPRYPNVFDFGASREYYGPSISDPRKQPDLWTTRPPSGFYDEQHPVSSMLLTGGVAAGIFASGYIPFRQGRMWDKYVGLMRGVEEYSPSGILRTFQASTFFSQFTSQARRGFYVRPDRAYANYLATLIGETAEGDVHRRILHEGVTLRGGKLFYGKGEEVALAHATVLISPASTKIGGDPSKWVGGELGTVAGKHYGSAYARSAGVELRPQVYGFSSKDARLYGDIISESGEQFHRQIIGGQNIFQSSARQVGAWGTEWVSRFNRLLEAPFEMQPFSTVFGGMQEFLEKRFGTRIQLAVPYSSGMKMLGNMALKYGPIAGAVALGYQTIDHLLRTSDVLEGSVLGTGIAGTIATGWIQANVLASKAAELTGLHTYRERQEEIAPGSTDLTRLLAFPVMGALGVAGVGYGLQVSKMAQLQRKGVGVAAARTIASEEIATWGEKGILSRLGKEFASTEGLFARRGLGGDIIRTLAEPVRGGPELSYKFLGKMTPLKLGALLGAGIGGALITPFLPGALIPSTRPDELEAIYSGEQEVGIRKGRWWEFGRSAWEGNRIQYYRPHWYPRMMMRARERAIWGDEEPTPLEKWWTREFTYDLEKRDYYERPYPITSLPFEDVPLIGPLLANTIGRLIKPPVLMHTEEWMDEDGVKAMAPGFGERRAVELGEQPPPSPISPFSTEGAIGEQIYRLQEMIGLPGFTMMSIKEAFTGTPDWYDQMAQLESSRRAYGFERAYWDMEIGGGAGTTEALRRLYPHRRRQIPLYNPIRNTMPTWLPGSGEKSPDFLHGDPYTKVKEGELRLPGKGYQARFPELEGLAPDEYPLIHQYKILADVAPYSDKFKLALQEVRTARKFDTWSEYEENIYATTQDQLQKRKVKKEFEEYEYLSPMGKIFDEGRYYADESSEMMAALNEMKRDQEGEPGVFTKIFGGYWEALSHSAETALDSLTPVSPGAKFVHQRTAIEDYHTTQVYGTENAFWSHPMRDFIRPTLTRMAAAFGFDGIPEHLKDKREILEYFDILEYVKSSRLSNLARMSGDTKAVHEFETKKNETLFGLNPFTYNYSNIFRSLPRSERDYFNAFSAADTIEERAKILDMVPENEKALYIARWKLQFKQDIEKAKKAGVLSEAQEGEADKAIADIQSEAKAEGMPTSKELFAEYLQTKLPGENYADWYRRTRILTEVPIPGPDWVGWHPSVDLEDVKLKLVQTMGEDIHEYDLWPSRAQALVNKPYINQAALAPIIEPEELSETQMRNRVNDVILANKIHPQTFFSTVFGTSPTSVIDIEQDVNIEEMAKGLL